MKFLYTILFFLTLFVTLNVHGENKSFNRIRTFDVQHYIIRLNFDRTKKNRSQRFDHRTQTSEQ